MIKANNAFSTKMLTDAELQQGVCMRYTLITEEEFKKNLEKADVVSIGHEDCAKRFGVEKNRIEILLEVGDTLYICEANTADKKRLAEGVKYLKEFGEGSFFRFIKAERIQ